MTVPSIVIRQDYVGAGTTDTFSYGWKITLSTELKVTTVVVATGVEANPAFTVTGVGDTGGGNIILTAGNLATGTNLTIEGNVAFTQLTDIRNQGTFAPEIHEDTFDHIANTVLQNLASIDGSLRLASTDDPAAKIMRMPVTEANKGWTMNAANDAIENVSLLDASAQATAAQASADAAAADAVLTAADVVTTNADVVLTNADVVLADAAVASIVPNLTNKSGGGHVLGDIVVPSGGTDNAVTNSTTQGTRDVIAVAAATINDNDAGDYRTAGEIVVNIKGTVTRNDFIRHSSTAKQAESAGTTVVDGVFGKALATGTDTTVNCLLGIPAATTTKDISKHSGEPALTVLRGVIASTATITAGTGFTIVDNGTGDHTVNFTASFTTLPAFTCSIDSSGAGAAIGTIVYEALSTSQARVRTFRDTDAADDRQFSFEAIGPE